MRSMLKAITGGSPDAIADLTQEIAAERQKGADASAKLEWLELEEKTADSYEQARSLAEQIAEQRWIVDHAGQRIPHLERQLKAARAQRQAVELARHHKAAERAYRKLRVAIEAAAAVQVEAIAARDAAIRDLGEGGAARIPVVAFMGILLPDLVEVWAAELERAFSGPPPKPTPAPPSTATIEKSLAHHKARFLEHRTPELATIVDNLEAQLSPAASRSMNPALADSTPEPPPRPKREPRHDTKPGKGERLVMILRSGVDVDGYQAANGDVIAVSIATAEALVRGGAAEFATATTEGVDS